MRYIYSAIYFLLFSVPILSFCQSTVAIESVNNKKRRAITYNENLEIIREDYFSKTNQQIIVSISYDTSRLIKKITGYENYPTVSYNIDFEKGTYFDANDGVALRFYGNFIFHGDQSAKNIYVNYQNNKKHGKLVQADSVAIGKKTIVYNKVDVRYLRYDIIKFAQELGEENVYKLYKGVILNFSDGKLNGKQLSYYGDGSFKVQAEFIKNKLLNYTSFSTSGSIISKLKTNRGVSSGGQLLNGVLLNQDLSYVYWNPDITNAGDIYFNTKLNPGNGIEYRPEKRYFYDTEGYGDRDVRQYISQEYYKRDRPYVFDFKDKFDIDKNTFSNPYVIKCLLNIPDFNILFYNFTQEEDKSIVPVAIDKPKIDSFNSFKTLRFNLSDGFFIDFTEPLFYKIGVGNISYLSLVPKYWVNFDHIPWSEFEKFQKVDNELGSWMKNSFNIENIFYLSPVYASDGDLLRFMDPTFSYDSVTIRKFMDVFVEIMLKNNLSSSFNPYIGVPSGYSFDVNHESHFNYFNFKIYGDCITIRNYDGIRYFKIFDKFNIEYFDGKCTKHFYLNRAGFDKVDIKCKT